MGEIRSAAREITPSPERNSESTSTSARTSWAKWRRSMLISALQFWSWRNPSHLLGRLPNPGLRSHGSRLVRHCHAYSFHSSRENTKNDQPSGTWSAQSSTGTRQPLLSRNSITWGPVWKVRPNYLFATCLIPTKITRPLGTSWPLITKIKDCLYARTSRIFSLCEKWKANRHPNFARLFTVLRQRPTPSTVSVGLLSVTRTCLSIWQ